MRQGVKRLMWGLGLAASGVVVGAAPAVAQTFSAPVIARMPPSSPGGSGPGGANATMFANPYTNPYMNPYLNPWMTQMPTTGNRSDALMFFMAAQRAQGGIGSPYGPGGSGGLGTSGTGAAGAGAGAGRASAPFFRRGGGLPAQGRSSASDGAPAVFDRSSRTRPRGYVAGRFDSNPSFNDGRGRLAGQYSAFGSTLRSQDGRPLVPDGAPVANERVRSPLNSYPSYNANNGR